MELQKSSHDIWEMKYQLKTNTGEIVDATPRDSNIRVAKALAEGEVDKEHWFNEFLYVLENGATPAGRIISNAGAGEHKPSVSLINCTVSETLKDSIKGIFGGVDRAAQTLAAGCGIGYEFSTLRPKGAYVSGAGATTSGSLPFMDVFDKMCFTIASAGGRRGAQMATMDIHHPDAIDFIKAKREDGRLRQFNLSLLITDDFVQAVKDKALWTFSFPVSKNQYDVELGEYIYRKVSGDLSNYVTVDGLTACEKYNSIPAEELNDLILKSTYDYAEPGFLLIDEINRMNPLNCVEDIRSSNPCAEQPLPPHGSCLLGSINLALFVSNPFTENASFDFVRFRGVVKTFTRLLDNVVDQSNLPLPEQEHEIKSKRRHGMGYTGLGSAMVMLGIKYGSERSIQLTDDITRDLVIEGWYAGVELAKEKGCAPVLEDATTRKGFIDSKYMQRILAHAPNLQSDMEEYGSRFTHHSSIAPTGTISLSVNNNCSNGIEPSFAHHYSRNVIVSGKQSKEKVDVYSYELLLYKHLIDADVDIDNLPSIFQASEDLTPKDHIDVQSAAQYWIDSAISKTINIPTDFPFEEFKGVYDYAIEKGLKGCTTFRYNPENFQGVLVKESDLADTTYEFSLEDGTTVIAKGNDTITYENEEHSAANLYDAFKEGYWGKF